MKAVALAFLLGAAVVYVVTRLYNDAAPWVGYVQTMAEASMVGGLADWFAVTALFRHPLGLPIPHTAIIPRKKDALGKNLSEFVGTNFLAEVVVTDKLHRVGIGSRLGNWLAQPRNAERATAELATALRALVTVLRDEDVQPVLENAVVRHLVERPWGPPLGRLLSQLLIDGTHHKLVDMLTERVYEWVRDNHGAVLRVVSQRLPAWSPRFVDELVADRLYGEVLAFAWAVHTEPDHPMRIAVDTFLLEFADDLRTDPEMIERAEAIKLQVLAHPEVQILVGSAWGTAKKMLLGAAEDPSSELRRRVRDALIALGRRLVEDAELRSKVDNWLQGVATYVVSNYRGEITALITDTVERWDAEETARKVELQVGRDLQFIRINGAVVGALAGLVIHTVSQLLL
ncbi:MAG: DUF445 domain-containing protein [Pseudonocardiales bacterium]|nr:DUF445 domain-containing protein [Pseudonocardiales bacterium]MBV9649080.1 DUF445 domain-containing protein [Pseudonocardiales bacterium]